jgi:hypothetical protein
LREKKPNKQAQAKKTVFPLYELSFLFIIFIFDINISQLSPFIRLIKGDN